MAHLNDREARQCKLLKLIQVGKGIGDNKETCDAVVPSTKRSVQLKTAIVPHIHIGIITARSYTPENLVAKMNTYLSQIFVFTFWKNNSTVPVHYVAATRNQRKLLFQRATEHVAFFSDYCKRPNVISSMSCPKGNELSLYGGDFRRAKLKPLTTKQAIVAIRKASGAAYKSL